MKNITNIILILFSLFTIGCLEKSNDKLKLNNTTIDDNLKNGIDLNNSFIEDIEFKKYSYNDIHIEQIPVDSLLNQNYRTAFFDYLNKKSFEENEYEQTFFIKLILVRIQQSDDIRSYKILSNIFNDDKLGYYLESYDLFLYQLFLYKPYYFIKGDYEYKQNELLDYINQSLPLAILTNKEYFNNNIASINIEKNSLLIKEKLVDDFTIKELKSELIKKSDKIEAYFSPSFETDWKNKTITYYNIYSYLNNLIIENLKAPELLIYDVKYKPFFETYIYTIQNQIAIIQDSDGFTNLRKDKTATSEILQKIKSGSAIDVLDNTGDWWFVQTKEGKKGYVHKSRIVNN